MVGNKKSLNATVVALTAAESISDEDVTALHTPDCPRLPLRSRAGGPEQVCRTRQGLTYDVLFFILFQRILPLLKCCVP